MQRLVLFVLSVLALVSPVASSGLATPQARSLRSLHPQLASKIGYASLTSLPHEQAAVVVKVAEGSDPEWLTDAQHVFGRWYRVPVAQGATAPEAVVELARDPEVELAELIYRTRPAAISGVSVERSLAPKTTIPNDPFFPAQWNFQLLQMPQAWDLTRGVGAKVAIIDSGVATGGEDLRCHVFSDEYDAFHDVGGPGAAEGDTLGHGTHVLGTIGQCTDNGKGVAGIAHQATLMPIRTDDPTDPDSFPFDAVARATEWARTHGASVINLSLGTDCNGAGWPACSSSVMNEAIDKATGSDVLIVAAAGNSNQGVVGTPANHPDVMAVSAVDLNSLAPYSNHGSGLSVAAPGGNAEEDVNDDGLGDLVFQETLGDLCGSSDPFAYCGFQGTSMASPHVAGAAALLRAYKPGASAQQVRQAIEESALDLGAPGFDPRFGHGLLQVRDALDRLAELIGGSGGSGDDTSPCAPGELTACLAQGRFEVTTTAPRSLHPGLAGRISPIFNADLGAAFHFFKDEENFHLVVKTSKRPSGFWAVSFFSGELLEWSVRVRDTWTGEVKQYQKPFGQLGRDADAMAFPIEP